MPISIELRWYQNVTLGELGDFVAHARAGGVGDEVELEPTGPEQDPALQDGWRVTLPGAPENADREVRLPASFARSVLELLNIIAESEGDVRGLQDGVVKTRDELLQALLGAE